MRHGEDLLTGHVDVGMAAIRPFSPSCSDLGGVPKIGLCWLSKFAQHGFAQDEIEPALIALPFRLEP